jgi:hypothetical protein
VLRARGWGVVSRDRVVRGSRSGPLSSRCSTVDDFMLGMAFEKIIFVASQKSNGAWEEKCA